MVKLQDIAKAAGVSVSTVSNVLNGRKNVGEDTARKIMQLVDEMGYEPNAVGKALKSGHSKTILFIFSDFDRKFYLDIIHGIDDYANANDYDFILCTSKSYEKFINKSLTCGSIVLDIRCSDEFIKKKAARGYQIVTLDRALNIPNVKGVLVNNYSAECELVEGLIKKGYKKFAFLGGLPSADTRERFDAFKDTLAKHGIPFRKDDYYAGDFREKSGYRTARLIMLSERMPEVLVCASDSMAIGALKAFREADINVPEDIAVCGFDDTTLASEYKLTTVSVPNYERGYLAAQNLVENVNGAGNYDTFMITAQVKWRETTR
ncbi:MAG: LacI family transcriptional regulator [Pseudobutyrivibrio sp.]|nr:LacI family transcriptional regulator [Pseudobutyrivibrio sp.]